ADLEAAVARAARAGQVDGPVRNLGDVRRILDLDAHARRFDRLPVVVDDAARDDPRRRRKLHDADVDLAALGHHDVEPRLDRRRERLLDFARRAQPELVRDAFAAPRLRAAVVEAELAVGTDLRLPPLAAGRHAVARAVERVERRVEVESAE